MLVHDNGQIEGTIGGGALELEAIRLAKETTEPWRKGFALGPNLGQCCGGHV